MSKLKFTGSNSHHGDVQLFEVESIPSTAKKVEKKLIAKSERSGHCHVLCGDYDMFETDKGETFVVVGTDGCTLNHTRYETLTPQLMSKNQATKIADHKPNFYKAGTKLFLGIQKRKKHFSKVWEKVQD